MSSAPSPSSRHLTSARAWTRLVVTLVTVVGISASFVGSAAAQVAPADPSSPASSEPASDSVAPTGTTTAPPTEDTSDPTAAPPTLTGPDGSPLGALSPTHPDEPRLGVPLETLSTDPRAAVFLDGAPISYPGGGGGLSLHLAVIDLATRNILYYSDTPVGLGFADLTAKVASYRPKSVLVVASAANYNPWVQDTNDLTTFARAVGAPPLTADAARRVVGKASFSIVGTPGSEGSGYTLVAPIPAGEPDGSPLGGDITGLLRWSPNGGRYSFVPSVPRLLDTSSSYVEVNDDHDRSTATGVNTVSVSRTTGTTIDPVPATYPVTLPVGKQDGFQVVSLDAQTLTLRSNTVVDTSGPAHGSDALRAALQVAFDPGAPSAEPPLVIVQSIGRPTADPGWQAAGDVLQANGGSRQSLVALNGDADSDLTFVGNARAGSGATLLSGKLGQRGPATAVLQPSHDGFGYLPQVTGVDGGTNLEQVRVDYQAPQAFPALTTAAERWIGERVKLDGCRAGSVIPCSFRTSYVTKFGQPSWHDIRTDLVSTSLTCPSDRTDFTQQQCQATLSQLRDEVDKYVRVSDFYDNLTNLMDKIANDPSLDVAKLGDSIRAAVTAVTPAPTTTFFDAMKMVSAIMGVVTLLVPEAKVVWGPLSTMYSLGATIYGAPPKPDAPDTTLADAVQVKTTDLANQARAALRNAVYTPTQEGQVVAGDWGKLQAAEDLVGRGVWQVDPDAGGYVRSMVKPVQTYFYKTLVTATYPWLVLTPEYPGRQGPDTFPCQIYPGSFGRFTVFQSLPRSGWAQFSDRFEGTRPYQGQWFFTKADPVINSPSEDPDVRTNTVPQSVADTMFGPGVNDLAINYLEFLSPTYFGQPHTLVGDRAFCGLR